MHLPFHHLFALLPPRYNGGAAAGYGGIGPYLIAVLDTGADLSHPDLYTSLWWNPGEIPGNGIDDDNNGWVDDVHGIDTVGIFSHPKTPNSSCPASARASASWSWCLHHLQLLHTMYVVVVVVHTMYVCVVLVVHHTHYD